MQTLNRWNYDTHTYDTIDYGGYNYNFVKYSTDMNELATCPHCLKDYHVGNMYTSLEFHDEIGLAYSVCSNCYEKEWERRKIYKKTEE